MFLSHGKNGYGAYLPNGTQGQAAVALTDEAYNAAGGTPTGTPGSGNNYTSYLFYYREHTAYDSACGETTTNAPFCEFDDIVAFIPATTMVARMVSAGNLP